MDIYLQGLNSARNLEPYDPANPIQGKRVVRLVFSTAFEPESGNFFSQNRWLEKIKYLRIKVLGGAVSGNEAIREGYLVYGGTSFIRNMDRGYPDPNDPMQIIDEMTSYSTRYWYRHPNLGWQSEEAFESPISVQIANDPDIPWSVLQNDIFQEYSVATSKWELYLPVSSSSGLPLIDMDFVTDVQIHFYFYWYARN